MTLIHESEHIQTLPWFKEYYVWLIILFPMLAVIGGVVTTILAVQSDDGLVVDDYYKQGLEINRTLERDQNAKDYALNASISLDSEQTELVLTLSAVTDFVYPENLSATILHATRSGLDKEVNLQRGQAYIYYAKMKTLERGKWYVYIQHDNWRLIETITIK